MSKENWTKNNIPDLSGKRIIVTGGNSGLGYESVKAFAENGAEVILTARTIENGENAKAEIVKGKISGSIKIVELDLADLGSVKKFADQIKKEYDKLDILLNNAGIMMTPYHKTKDGFEGQMGTNHLGHFALTGLLFDLIKETKGSRVINVSSNAHKWGKMDFDNLLFEEGKDYSPIKAYSRSKLSNILFTNELQRKFEENDINSIAAAAHPGTSETNLARYLENKWYFKILYPLVKGMFQDAAMGALPQIRASVDPNVKGGDYYGPDGKREIKGYPVKVETSKTSQNISDAKKLWERSEELTGVRFGL